MKISEALKSLKVSYTEVKGTPYEENQKLFIEMGWAIRRLTERGVLSLEDNFNDTHIKQLIFDEMNFDVGS